MEQRKNYLEKDLLRSKFGKLKQALQNIEAKGTITWTNHEKILRKVTGTTKNLGKCEHVNVTETYDEILDLRDKMSKGSSKNCISKKPLEAEQTFLDKVCEFPNMHYKIMALCSIKNSSKFSESFNVKTNIISERIVNKKLELQATEKPPSKPKPVCKAIPKLGDRIVIQKIIEKENELQSKKLASKIPKPVKSRSETKIMKKRSKSIADSKSDYDPSVQTPKQEISKPNFQLSTKPELKLSKTSNCYDIARFRFQRSIMAGMNSAGTSKTEMPNSRASLSSNLETKKSNVSRGSRSSCKERFRPRFILSTKPVTRCAISHSSVQVDIDMSSSCVDTQTDEKKLRTMQAQTHSKNITNEKKVQTRICKKNTTETDPILIEGPAKYTSTTCDKYRSEQPTQMYEYLTTNDLMCLDWVNRHLFGVTVNPHNIIIDDKIKEVSEVASKSTFLSEMDCLSLPR